MIGKIKVFKTLRLLNMHLFHDKKKKKPFKNALSTSI
jgi:hypothetical protein